MTLIDVVVGGNAARYADYGSGSTCGGGVCLDGASSVHFERCTITGNYAYAASWRWPIPYPTKVPTCWSRPNSRCFNGHSPMTRVAALLNMVAPS